MCVCVCVLYFYHFSMNNSSLLQLLKFMHITLKILRRPQKGKWRTNALGSMIISLADKRKPLNLHLTQFF